MGYRGKEKDQKGIGGGNHSRKTVLQGQKGPILIFGCRIRKASSRNEYRIYVCR